MTTDFGTQMKNSRLAKFGKAVADAPQDLAEGAQDIADKVGADDSDSIGAKVGSFRKAVKKKLGI